MRKYGLQDMVVGSCMRKLVLTVATRYVQIPICITRTILK